MQDETEHGQAQPGTALRLSYGFLLWTVERTRGVQDGLLGVVEELRDVLEVFG